MQTNYTLQTQSKLERDQWISAINQFIIRANELSKTGEQKRGSLTKKGKQRWFVLKDSTLMWFNSEVPPDKESVKASNGLIDLTQCKIMLSGFTLTVTVEDPSVKKNTYDLIAKDDGQAQDWYAALTRATSKAEAKLGALFGRSIADVCTPTSLHPMITDLTSFVEKHGT